ncbi:aspartate/glutamate racemase family protein [Streptomyces sp. NBC_01754]|uniref:maleate cis-trans isomerase family protein n=1 Tax=Streptomyces sp. NBC_01754 TaxID=2975930 RepID=UPI002DDB0510|nr:aspartate/glutamate racemase family protein [Streptomyces sp. NBC_01754]WSC93490.1 aspartate/glutamate racemase family protein [Streptomyces sp. NBC_01754]
MSLGFGHLARIGHLYPSGGLCDHEIQLMAPDGVQFVTTRLPFRSTGIRDDLRLVEDLERHAGLLADAEVDLVAVNCTAATLLAGPERIKERIRAATGIEAVTTIEAVLAALRALGIRRPALLTPYPDEVVEAERTYLRSHGVEVVTHLGIPCATPVEQAVIEPGRWFGLASSVDPSTVDGVLLSCAGIRVASELRRIEHRLGLPVVASNQALLWQLLRDLRIPAGTSRYGSLLDDGPDRAGA